jgi:ADP-dependent NAD(P)H-hydrate dehydratase
VKPVEEIPHLPRREPDTHKGTYGRVLLIAGSEGMTGAAILSARAAYRAGAGLVAVGIDRTLFGAISPAVPEAIFVDTTCWRERLPPAVLDGYEAVLLGPGIGLRRIRDLAWHLLESREGPLAVDADGLNILASEPDHSIPRRAARVWTPHPGEFARLTGEHPRGDAERAAAAERFVKARGGVLVLKGWHTVVMDEEGYAINRTGNPGMATAGAGDVLSGMIAAFLGQGMPPFAAARLAVHLHGRAGDLAAADLGEASLMAGDIVERIPRAILENQR